MESERSEVQGEQHLHMPQQRTITTFITSIVIVQLTHTRYTHGIHACMHAMHTVLTVDSCIKRLYQTSHDFCIWVDTQKERDSRFIYSCLSSLFNAPIMCYVSGTTTISDLRQAFCVEIFVRCMLLTHLISHVIHH